MKKTIFQIILSVLCLSVQAEKVSITRAEQCVNNVAGKKQIIWKVLEECEVLVGDKIRFKVSFKTKKNKSECIEVSCEGSNELEKKLNGISEIVISVWIPRFFAERAVANLRARIKHLQQEVFKQRASCFDELFVSPS
jgi:hypothetical protein